VGLTLSILRCPDRVAPETRRFEGGEVVIGRGPGADWVLADPSAKPLLSRRHCTIAFRAGAWTLTDSSTNGTTLNGTPAPEGQPTRALRDGDRLGIGPYEIEVSMAAEASAFRPSAGFDAAPAQAPVQAAPSIGGIGLRDDWLADDAHSASPFGGSPFGAPAFGTASTPSQSVGQDPFGAAPFGAPSIILPADFGDDLLAPAPSPPPAQPDHTPSFGDVLQPPIARTLLPSSWDDEPVAAAPPPASAPFAVTPPPAAEAPVIFAEPEAAFPSAGLAPPPQPPRTAPAEGGLLAAFLEGAALSDAQPQNPIQALREAGAAFRAFVHGLRRVLIARAEVKSAFRIDQTMVRSRNNNPLKFAVSDDDALAALLGAGRRSDMAAAVAVQGALNDIRLHELATMAAMQEAMTELLGKLDPAKFFASAEGGMLPGQKRARAFDLYEAEFKKLREAFSEKFDDAFGRAFAVAYERVIADLQDREPLH